MKTQTFLTLMLAFILISACKNKNNGSDQTKYYELSITDPNGVKLSYTVNNKGLLAGLIDSIQYGLTFSDGPNESVITKLYRLDYAVNETAKVLQITKVIAAVDTIPNNSSKKLNGGNNQLFDVNLTGTVFKKNDNGWNECGQTGVCCSIGQDNKISCCGSCNPIPDNCSSCGLKNPFNTPLTMSNPESEPTLNELFRNYNTLTVKLK